MRASARPFVACGQLAIGLALAFVLLVLGGGRGPVAQSAATAGVQPAPAPPRDPATPTRVILTWRDDPTTSQAVTWRTDATAGPAIAEIAPADANPGFVKTAARTAGATRPLELAGRRVYYHEAHFTGLQPATLYAYRVGNGAVWSEWLQFRTASRGAAPFSFVYLGDAQNEIRSLWSRAIRAALLDAPRARFILHAGDLVDNGNSDAQWEEWFEAGGWLNGMIPSVPVTGNHEYVRPDRTQPPALSLFWRPQFALPENGPAALVETVYSLDYQGLRLIVLNSNERTRLAEQASFLEARLRDNPNRWTVVTFHHPVHSLASDRDNPDIRAAFQPLFDRYGVDVVLQGHDHTYGRGTSLPTGSPRRRDPGGTIYVVSVSGPKMYQIGPGRDWAVRTGTHTQLYQVIRVEEQRLRFEARKVTGDLFDAFDLLKDRRGRKRLVERGPAPADKPRTDRPND